MKQQEAFKSFDDITRKGFNYHEIVGALSLIVEDEKRKSEYAYEVLAFSLTPSHGNNPWGYYYGPTITYADKDGNPVYFPALDEITADAVLYWERRIGECVNPLLKVRYAGLVWDFKQKIAHQTKTSENYRAYVDSMLTVCNEDFSPHPTITANILEHLFSVAKGQNADLLLVKQAYVDFESRYATDESVRYWASRFLIMLDNKKCFEQKEIEDLIQEHEGRLVRLAQPEENKDINPWLVEDQADLLARYYNIDHNKEEVKRVLVEVETSFIACEKIMSSMQLMGNLEKLYWQYRHYGLELEAKGLSARIQKLGAKAMDEMVPHQIEFEIPKKVYDQADEVFGVKAESDDVRWENFIVSFIPRKNLEEKDLQKQVEKHPFQYMITKKIVDPKGRPSSVVGPYESDPDGQLIMYITELIHLRAYYLGIAVGKLIEVGTLTTDKVIADIIKPSPLFEEERYPIIQEALHYFLAANYSLFCHLIVPQIENSICNLVDMSGVSVIKPQRKGSGFQLQTLDELLREKVVSDTITEDGAYYLRLVLTDQRALNIRNSLCHGILPPSFFGFDAAARLLHILVMLGSVRYA